MIIREGVLQLLEIIREALLQLLELFYKSSSIEKRVELEWN